MLQISQKKGINVSNVMLEVEISHHFKIIQNKFITASIYHQEKIKSHIQQ
jgi:hypothetical protein